MLKTQSEKLGEVNELLLPCQLELHTGKSSI